MALEMFHKLVKQYILLTGINYISFQKDELIGIAATDITCDKINIEQLTFYSVDKDHYQVTFKSNEIEYDFNQLNFQYLDLCNIIWDKLKEYEDQYGVG